MLQATDKERYRELCGQEEARVPLFLQPWWMDAVCGSKPWGVLLSERRGRIVGALPCLFGCKLGLRYVVPPELTPFSGPWLAGDLDSEGRIETLSDLAAQVDALHLALYCQRLAPEVDNWLPFFWHGFRETTRYTYRFEPLEPLDVLMAKAHPQRRKRLDLLRGQCVLDRQVGVDEFVAFHNDYYMRRSGYNLLAPATVQRVCSAALRRGSALLYGLRSGDGRLMVADFVVYDSLSAHSLLSGMAADAPRNSMTLLFWHLIEDLYGHTSLFDFEGSMDPGIGQFFRSFGARLTPLHCVYRSRIPFGRKLLNI